MQKNCLGAFTIKAASCLKTQSLIEHSSALLKNTVRIHLYSPFGYNNIRALTGPASSAAQ
jgi:hypothetical protein